MTTVFKTEIAGYEITLQKGAEGVFIVCYGYQQYKTNSYEQAAKELGKCIMHALACEGKLFDGEE